MSEGDFLSRWSRRKTAAKAGVAVPAAADAGPPAIQTAEAPSAVPQVPSEPEPLPPIESLTPESDFTPFMKGEVDPGLRRQALKALFQDPRFNVMDGLDVYIDDYTKADPLPEGWLEKLNMATRLGDYPARVEAERLAELEARKAAEEVAKVAAEAPAPVLGAQEISKQEQMDTHASKQGLADTSDAGSSPAPL